MINEKYSHKTFPYHGLSFKDKPASEFNDTEIVGSCFYQEWREDELKVVKDIFPTGITGMIFRRCNLDNILIPPGNVVESGTNKVIKVQNDWDDWFLDSTLKPIEPLNKKIRLLHKVSINPQSIPTQKFTPEQREAFVKLLEPLVII